MKSDAGRDFEESTTESLNYDGQILATRQNKYSQLSNPSAEPIMFYYSKLKDKVIRKSSAGVMALYNINKRIRELVRRLEYNPVFEQQVTNYVQQVLELGALSTKRLDALVAAALYLVHRLHHSQIFLSQIMGVFGVRSADISRCLAVFKKLGLYQEVEILSLWSIYVQIVDQWFPYQIPLTTATTTKASAEEGKELEFALTPERLTQDLAVPEEKGQALDVAGTDSGLIRQKMLQAGRVLTELSEVDLAKQGKLPQTFAAGVFMVVAKYFSLQIPQKEVAKRLDISTSAVAQSKKLIVDILTAKASGGGGDGDSSSSNTNGESGPLAKAHKWALICGFISSSLKGQECAT